MRVFLQLMIRVHCETDFVVLFFIKYMLEQMSDIKIIIKCILCVVVPVSRIPLVYSFIQCNEIPSYPIIV